MLDLPHFRAGLRVQIIKRSLALAEHKRRRRSDRTTYTGQVRHVWLVLCVPLLAGCQYVFRLADEAAADAGADAAIQPPGVAVERATSAQLPFTLTGEVNYTVGSFSGRLMLVAVAAGLPGRQ